MTPSSRGSVPSSGGSASRSGNSEASVDATISPSASRPAEAPPSSAWLSPARGCHRCGRLQNLPCTGSTHEVGHGGARGPGRVSEPLGSASERFGDGLDNRNGRGRDLAAGIADNLDHRRGHLERRFGRVADCAGDTLDDRLGHLERRFGRVRRLRRQHPRRQARSPRSPLRSRRAPALDDRLGGLRDLGRDATDCVGDRLDDGCGGFNDFSRLRRRRARRRSR